MNALLTAVDDENVEEKPLRTFDYSKSLLEANNINAVTTSSITTSNQPEKVVSEPVITFTEVEAKTLFRSFDEVHPKLREGITEQNTLEKLLHTSSHRIVSA